MKLYLSPTPKETGDNNGVGRVVHAQYRYLPDFGIELVDDPDEADVIAAHITADHLPRVDVLHCHGMYWSGDGGEWQDWHHQTNWRIGIAARRARAITVPSEWVAMSFKRDMRISPHVVGHGIDLDEWERGENKGHILWNKNRSSAVCDPAPAVELFKRGLPVVSTFGIPEMNPTGTLPFAEMKNLIQTAAVYLSTAKETFGIGTLEAMACGVPILGYDWGGNRELIIHGWNGYLAEPGDIDDLERGYRYIMSNYSNLAENALDTAEHHTWNRVMQRYADLYHSLLEPRPDGVCVVITNYNYGRYVDGAIESVLKQTRPADEIVIVDDGSTDDSQSIISRYADHDVFVMLQDNRGVAAARNAGIAATDCPFIVCLDADDELHPEYIESLIPAIRDNPQYGIVYSGLELFNDDGRVMHTDWPPEFSFAHQSSVNVPPANCVPSAAMFRREMWRRAGGVVRQGKTPAEDVEFWTRGLSYGFEAKKVADKRLFRYRLHGDQAHKTKKYKRIDNYLPWMRTKQYPFAAPVGHPVAVRSYSEPLISVIVPVGPGHEKHIHMALESLAGQSVTNWEAIVVNDTGQPFETLPFARVVGCHGRSAGAARNLGMELASGELVYFLDADDYLLPEALAVMLAAFVEHEGERYIYTDYVNENAQGKKAVTRLRPYDQHNWRGQHAVNVLMWRADALKIGGFDEELIGWEDWDFQIQMQINGICGQHVQVPTFVYRFAEGARREESLNSKSELLPLLKERYGKHFNGELMSCGCGGGDAAATLLKAKQSLGFLSAQKAEIIQRSNGESDMIRMEYIGQNTGAIAFSRVGGQLLTRVYRGGNNPGNKYVNAASEDVALLESTGKWKMVNKPPVTAVVPVPPTEVEDIPAPAPEIFATDGAIREAGEAGIDLVTVEGTGKDGKVTVSDVRSAIRS